MCFFNTINFRIRMVSWRCAAIPTLGAAAHLKKQPAPPPYSSAGSPLLATANPLPLPVREGKTRRRSEQKFVPPEEALTLTLSQWERGWICCTSEKSSLHISGNIQSESAGCFFTAEKPHRPKFAGTPIPPNQARYAFAAAAHTPNPAHRQDSASPRLSR